MSGLQRKLKPKKISVEDEQQQQEEENKIMKPEDEYGKGG